MRKTFLSKEQSDIICLKCGIKVNLTLTDLHPFLNALND